MLGMALISILLFGGLSMSMILLWLVLQIAANWRIFKKAGYAGWKSLIPVYSEYVSYKIAWRTVYFWITLFLELVVAMISGGDMAGVSGIQYFAYVVCSILSFIVQVMYCIKLARSFGKGTWFMVGLVFLNPIFLVILGFDSSTYQGADL